MRRLLALAIAATMLGACGFGELRERRQLAELLIETPERVLAAGTARFAMQQDLVPIELTNPGLGDYELFLLPFGVSGELDARDHRAVLSVDPANVGATAGELEQLLAQTQGEPPETSSEANAGTAPRSVVPLFVFDDLMAYARSVEAIQQMSLPDGTVPRRSWARIDLATLVDPASEVAALGFNAINPVVLLELLAGTLSGSVRRMGAEHIGDVATTRYEVNLDREKAFRDHGDERVMELEGIFELMRVGGVVVPATVWLDEEGLPRRVDYRFEQRLDRRNAFELRVRLELTDFGAEVDIPVPGPDETVEVTGFVSLLREAGVG